MGRVEAWGHSSGGAFHAHAKPWAWHPEFWPMTITQPTDPAATRRLACGLLIAIAVGIAAGRVLSAQRVTEPVLSKETADPADKRTLWPGKRPAPSPLFGSNDR